MDSSESEDSLEPVAVPKVGGVKRLKEGLTPYVGGKPNLSFTSAVDITAVPRPTQFRSLYLKTDVVQSEHRQAKVAGVLFKDGCNL